MLHQRTSRKRRRGASPAEVAVALALIAVAVLTGGYYLSTNTSSELEQTSNEIADPSALADRFLQ